MGQPLLALAVAAVRLQLRRFPKHSGPWTERSIESGHPVTQIANRADVSNRTGVTRGVVGTCFGAWCSSLDWLGSTHIHHSLPQLNAESKGLYD